MIRHSSENKTDDEDIKLYLDRDRCLKTSDKYLLAMVLTYFRRAKLRIKEYRQYFFPSLFLANQFEEDEEFRDEIYAWTPGRTLRTIKRNQLFHLRDLMLIKMDFRAWVEKETCDLIMAQDPDHWAWKRQREDHHSWAIRWFRRDISEFTIRGPWTTLPTCSLCNPIGLNKNIRDSGAQVPRCPVLEHGEITQEDELEQYPLFALYDETRSNWGSVHKFSTKIRDKNLVAMYNQKEFN
ncbi:speedy protein 1-A-like [Leptodactylus fuscus]